LLHPSRHNEQSKAGTQGDTLLWDVREFTWLDKLFPTLKAGAPVSKLWLFHYYGLCKQIKKAAGKMHISFVPYQLRHSGASGDMAKNYRTALEVQKRGTWRTTTSLVRYEKHGKMISEYERIPLGTRGW